MAREINLLVDQKRAVFVDMLRPLKLLTVIFLIFYCLVSLAITSYFVYLDVDGTKINKEIDAKKGQITRLRKVESLAVMNKQRLSALASFFSQRQADMPSTIGKMQELAGNEILLNQIKMNTDGSLDVGAATSHPFYFVNFYNRLMKEKDFPSLTLSSLSRDVNGGYRFNMVIKLWQQ